LNSSRKLSNGRKSVYCFYRVYFKYKRVKQYPPVSAARLHVTGIVQGVGFRPFVRRLALQLDLPGSVRNTADGVCILLPDHAVDLFQKQLIAGLPRLARVDCITSDNCDDELSHPFEIHPSLTGDVTTGVAPDAAICTDCITELTNPADRRYGYPFLNCTNCGPRFSIVRTLRRLRIRIQQRD